MTAPAARMRAPSQKVQVLETDIVIIGGGVAGCLAALGAAEVGAKVVICEKGGIIERSGSVAAGVDHYIAILEEGQEWDTPDYLLRHIPKVTEGVTDIEAAGRLVYGLKPMVKYLEDLGADFHDPDHDDIPYYRHRAFGLPGEYHINFDGHNFKRSIGHAVRKTRAKVLERVMVSEILMDEGRPRGVVAFHIRHGTVYFILAKAVIVTTGDANRIGRNASGFAFDSWHMPYNTGDGHAMALRVGTKLANMEFTDCTLTPKGYSTQGLNAFVGGGAYFINTLGERFLSKYTPDAERAKRADLVNGVVSELLAGRGPIYCDCTHLPLPEIRKLERTLGVDRPALPIYFEQRKIDLAKEPFEIVVGEIATVRAGALFRGAGIDINADCASNVPGLFAAGDCSSVNAAVAGAAVMGHVAGLTAGRYIQSQPKPHPVSNEEQERIRETLYKPLQKDKGILFNQFEDEVRAIVTGLIGYRRDEARLQEAQRRLHALKEREAELMAEDYHGVMRVNEARSVRTVAEVLAVSALARRETRGGAAHYRVDYPKRDDENFLKIIMVAQEGDELQASSRPTNIPPTVLPESPLKSLDQQGV
jgi:adenylylsulfate reductase subunit A